MELKLHPPIVFLICAGLMKLMPNLWQLHLPLSLSYLFMLIGTAVALSGLYAFHQAKTTIDPHHIERTSSLVQTGIYRFTRNPMYLGLALWLTAWVIWLGNPVALGGVVLFIGYITQFQILPEEKMLTEKFGQSYKAYQASVRRWL